MNTIYLYGALGNEFGTEHRFKIANAGEVFQALAVNFPRFMNALRHGFYKVIIGKRSNGTELDEESLLFPLRGTEEIHVVPVTAGRARGGAGKVLAGLMLVGFAAFGGPLAGAAIGANGVTVGSVAGQIGLGLTLTGAAQLISPAKEAGGSDPSYTMAGPVNSTREGGIVPLAYGECVIGGTMISGQLRIENAVSATSTEASTVLPIPAT